MPGALIFLSIIPREHPARLFDSEHYRHDGECGPASFSTDSV